MILLVLRLDYTSLRNMRRTMDNLVELGIGLEKVQVVVNGCRQAGQLRVKQAEEALGMKFFHHIPNDPARANRAINKGIPVVLHNRSARISRSIRDLAVSVNGNYKQQ